MTGDAGAPDALTDLLAIMVRLRDPERGCPWDRQQDFASIAPYTLEEAYEVADAIARNDIAALRDELGDLLFQVVFHARMAEEAGHFDFGDVAAAIADKMRRRHPHVFGDADIDGEAALRDAWEENKRRERVAGDQHSHIDGVARALPALSRADKLQRRAARAGFDWDEVGGALAKIREELAEVEAELEHGDRARIESEIGDLLFAVVNVSRWSGFDSEQVLRSANDKFERRFRAMEALLVARHGSLEGLALAEMEAAWQQVKRDEA